MPAIISTLFIIVSLFCLISGIYILYLSHNQRLNKISFYICASLCCLAYGISKSLIASDINIALNWRRFSEAASLSAFAFLLDFTLTVVLKEKMERNHWIKVFIYLPSIIFIYIMSLSDNISYHIYKFTESPIGLVNCPEVSIWAIACNLYILFTMTLGLVFLIYWVMKNLKSGNNIEKQSKMILFSYIITYIMIALSQLVFHFVKNIYIHEIAPIFIPIPIIIVFLAVVKFQFMQESEEDIIMEQFRTRIIKYLSLAYLFGGVIYYITQSFGLGNENTSNILLFSGLLIMLGIGIYFIQKYSKNEKLNIMIYSLLLTITVPLILLRYANSSALTVWAFPFLIIIASVLLYDSAIFIMVSTVTLVILMYLWIFIPFNVVTINETDHFGRIAIFIVAACLVSYINSVYVKRLKQLSKNMKDNDLILQISSMIIDMSIPNKKDKFYEIMEVLGQYFRADKVHVYIKSLEFEKSEPDYIVWNSNIKDSENISEQKSQEEWDLYEMNWWKSQIRENGLVKIKDIEDLPFNAVNEKQILLRQDTKSLISVPIAGKSIQSGYLRIDFQKDRFNYNSNISKTLSTIGNILGKAEDKNSIELEMENMAYYDQLTKIPNRYLFGKYVEQWIKHSKKSDNSFCILFLDIDSFKNINDISGHHFGDMVLKKVAERIGTCLKKTDILCRFGGDEFLIMLHYAPSKNEVSEIAGKIIQKFQQPIIVDKNELNITVSMGISMYPADGTDKETLIKNADIAMYRAKTDGKNRFVFCSEKMKDEISREMILTGYLYKALEKGEFHLVYQPQIQTDHCEMVAVEALLRWNNPVLGNISPTAFISIAEKTGLIVPIGEWVLLEACRQNKKWQDAGYPPIRMAVNVSMNQILTDEFPDIVKWVLDSVNMDPKYLEIEITENVAMQESTVIIESLNRLKELGVSIAIDDFGVEYSSLNRIKDLPIDRIKLDIQFIRNILINEKEREITDAIINLAKKLDLKVIAEGVEEKEQFLYLKQKECNEIQGYYFYKPLPASEVEEVLKTMSK